MYSYILCVHIVKVSSSLVIVPSSHRTWDKCFSFFFPSSFSVASVQKITLIVCKIVEFVMLNKRKLILQSIVLNILYLVLNAG